MSFIDDFEAIPPADVGARVGLFFQALAVDWAGLFADLRRRRPILDIGAFIVVSRWADVIDILSRAGTFRVPYQPHMDDSVGPYMLGRDETELNWHDKSLMRALMRWDDLPGIRAFARSTAEAAVAGAGDSVDVVAKVSRLVPLRVVQQSFGFPGPDDTSMLRWSKATQADMFHNLVNDPAVLVANNTAGTEMRAWLRTWLASRRPWGEAKGEDVVSRLLRATDAGLSAFDEEEVVSNICGLLVGAVETTSQAIVNAAEQILLRPEVKARAIAAAQANDMETFDAIVWEALRFNPMGSLVVRVAAEDSVLAPGSEHEMKITAGRAILVGIGSAMFDPGVFPEPDEFRARPRNLYIHTGFGPHECLGRYVAYAIIPEAVRAIMLLPGVHLLEGDASKVDNAGGPFAERFVVGVKKNGTSL
jgi:cytochrome P450